MNDTRGANMPPTRRSGPVPYGYALGHKDDPESPGRRPVHVDLAPAQAVASIFAARTKGHTYARIADGLNADGVPAPRGGRWSASAVRNILLDQRYTGADPEYPAIVSGYAHMPPPRQERRSGSRTSHYALNGLVRCGLCGAKMQVERYNRRSDDPHSPRCVKFRCRSRHADGQDLALKEPSFHQRDAVPLINAWLMEDVLPSLSHLADIELSVEAGEAVSRPSAGELEVRLRSARAEEEELLRAPFDGDLEDQARRLRDLVTLRRETLEMERQLSEAPPSEVLAARPTIADVLSASQAGEWIPEALHAAYAAVDLAVRYDPAVHAVDAEAGGKRTRLPLRSLAQK